MEAENFTATKKYEMLSMVYKEVQKAKIEWEQSMDSIDDLVILTDLDGSILRCNKKLTRLTGKSFNEILGENWPNIFKQFGFREEQHRENHIDIVHKSGERFHIDTCSVKNSNDVAFGSVIYLHNVTKLALLNKKVNDKNIELNKAYTKLNEAQSQILQQEKMASIGQLAAGIAHEINNPIGFILSNLCSLRKYTNKIVGFINEQSKVIKNISGHLGKNIQSELFTLEEKKGTAKLILL